jgi:hypothetical protein
MTAGPRMMPATSSPRRLGRLIFLNSSPRSLAARRMMASFRMSSAAISQSRRGVRGR